MKQAFINKVSSPRNVVGDLPITWSCHKKDFSLCNTTTQSAEDSRQKHSEMTSFFNVKAFTLIELLVVVLIIGILAAVALPQYRKAVVKTRATTILPVLKSIKDAQEVYYLTNGEYTLKVEDLDISLPANCTLVNEETGEWKCGKDFLVDMELNGVLASYCPEKNDSYENCAPNRIFQLGYYYAKPKAVSHVPPNVLACWRPNSSPVTWGTDLCKTLGTPLSGPGVSCTTCYQIQ